ncbi:hypothetical protein [Lactococcus allomyrinae]|uniref:Uncharacterized protein n=1 Tax=Lactococcus allomyrinae TaxID=2419773 RepID=A0A387BDQ7_9LACT|nr:hypothetical protein [Lactococcus allomyrinae]AYF99798.1 hypothetical protein D7I46_01085 [Lactococcus allomyrinae]
MGYTNYFTTTKKDFNSEFIALARKIVELSDVSTKGWDGTKKAEFNLKTISLNGDASNQEDFETFELSRFAYDFRTDDYYLPSELKFAFTKTERLPYSFNGKVTDSEFIAGANLFNNALDYFNIEKLSIEECENFVKQ